MSSQCVLPREDGVLLPKIKKNTFPIKTMPPFNNETFPKVWLFHWKVAVNRNTVNTHDFTSSVAGTQICQLRLVWGFKPFLFQRITFQLLLFTVQTHRCGRCDITKGFIKGAFKNFSLSKYSHQKAMLYNRSCWESEFLRRRLCWLCSWRKMLGIFPDP